MESLSPLIISSASPWPVVDIQTMSITPNNHSLTYLQTGPFDPPHCHVPLARGAVSSVSLASTDLLYYIEPLPLDQLVCHSARTVPSWPTTAREELLAVAHRDMAVARNNMADLTRYLDMHSVHLAACSGAMDDALPLMSAECDRWGPVDSRRGSTRPVVVTSTPTRVLFFGTRQKVRTVCLSAWSMLMLLSISGHGDMNFQNKLMHTISLASHITI